MPTISPWFATGLELDELLAQLSMFVEGRRLDDDVQILLRWKGGAKGMLWTSQIAVGNENSLTLRVSAAKTALNGRRRMRTGSGSRVHALRLAEAAPDSGAPAFWARRVELRAPPGHPEGYLEGFAIYAEAACAIHARPKTRS